MKRILPLVLAAAAAAGPAGAAEGILPGYWESTNRVLSPIRTKDVERRCITPEEVQKFMMGPSNRHYKCTYPVRSFEGGKILLKGTCVSKKGRQVEVSGQGAFTPTSFTLTANIATTFAGIPISGRASTEAHRISDVCPAKPTEDSGE